MGVDAVFQQGDSIDIELIDEEIRKTICETLQANEEDISYSFVEYDGTACVLSVQTDKRYAIVHCPASKISEAKDYSFEAEWLLDDLIRSSYLDHALETRNETLFRAVLAYRNTPKPKGTPEQKKRIQLHYEGVYDLEDGKLLFGDDLSFGTNQSWISEEEE